MMAIVVVVAPARFKVGIVLFSCLAPLANLFRMIKTQRERVSETELERIYWRPPIRTLESKGALRWEKAA